MELLSLSCNKCGAPLSVPSRTNFITCSYCKSQLAIHQEGGAIYTELLGQIDQKTTQILDQVNNLVDITRDVQAGSYSWELCEVLWRVSTKQDTWKNLTDLTIEFLVQANGSRGNYLAGVSHPSRARFQKLAPNLRIPKHISELEELLNGFCQMLVGQGWQAYDIGQFWYSRKFRRRFR